MNIRTRLTLQFTLMVSAIFLIAFLMIYFLKWQQTKHDFYKRLENKALTAANLLVSVEEVDADLLKKIDQTNQDVFFNENLSIYDAHNQEIYTNNDQIHYTLNSSLLNQIRAEKRVQFTQGKHQVIGVFYVDAHHQVVSIAGAEDQWGQQNLANLRSILLGLFLVVILIVALSGWYFSGQALSPISRVIGQVKKIYPNRFEQPLSVENPKDEIGLLTLTFNELLERIAEVLRLQNLFISNVSHELKNPLMRIGMQIDVTMLRNRSVGEYQALFGSVREDIRELGQLSEALLELAKITDEEQKVIYTQVRTDEVLWEARSLLLEVCPNYSVVINFDDNIESENQFVVTGNYHLLKTAFVNLMENGCKFSNNATVDVQVVFEKSGLRISFQNTGSIISEEELKLIFQPFYRIQNSSHIKGYGVGLSLVERILKIHNGSIEINSYHTTATTVFYALLPYALVEEKSAF